MKSSRTGLAEVSPCLSYALELRREAYDGFQSSVVGSMRRLRAPYVAMAAVGQPGQFVATNHRPLAHVRCSEGGCGNSLLFPVPHLRRLHRKRTPRARERERQGEEDRSRQASASRFCMASQRPSERRRRGCEDAPPKPRQRCLLCVSRRQLPARSLVNTPTRLPRMRRSPPVPVFAEQARSSPLNPSSTIY